jgi:hypothetical protein
MRNDASKPLHPFEPDPKDHCETDVRAHRDIVTALTILAKRVFGYQNARDLKIWDPYFCDGKVKKNFARLGFPNCYNECEDFYKRIEKSLFPDHDVIVTNPPYSTEHIERCLTYCVGQEKPWLMLVPNWVARKDFFSKLIGSAFVLSPVQRYEYWMPGWAQEGRPEYVGADGKHSPFLSSWFIGMGKRASMETEGGTGTPTLTTDDFFNALDDVAQGREAPEFLATAGDDLERMEWVVARTAKGTKWKIKKQEEMLKRATRKSKNGGVGTDRGKQQGVGKAQQEKRSKAMPGKTEGKKRKRKTRQRLPRHLRAAAARAEARKLKAEGQTGTNKQPRHAVGPHPGRYRKGNQSSSPDAGAPLSKKRRCGPSDDTTKTKESNTVRKEKNKRKRQPNKPWKRGRKAGKMRQLYA